MRKLICVLSLVVFTLCLWGIPAKKTGWKTIRLDNGAEVRAMLKGDEYLHYMEGEDGQQYVFDEHVQAFRLVDLRAMATRASRKRQLADAQRLARKRVMLGGQHTSYTGAKKALMILVEFTDCKFNKEHTQQLYQQICNTRHFRHDAGFQGSVSDYFHDQSRGMFDLTFDVVGPVQLKNGYAYYGANDRDGYDLRPDEMVQEACMAVDAAVDFSDYDWNHDGQADAIYILYAGLGENATDGKDTKRIWPHQAELSSTNFSFRLDNVTINPYACGPERSSQTRIGGIGTICHEFSHVLGLPDMYDTAGGDAYGMFSWDVMDQGSYNSNGFLPAGYTSYERAYFGWLKPEELAGDCAVDGMKPLSEEGKAYIVYNDNDKNEYYLLENRRRTGWDAGIGGEGLLILHVDYDPTAWADNEVNADASHQRCTIFHADNSDAYLTPWGAYSASEIAGDVYPYKDNNALTATTTPKASLYNKNRRGTFLMDKDVTDITRHGDGTISFNFKASKAAPVDPSVQPSGGVYFHESFDQCTGTGGNDGAFSGQVATRKDRFVTDMDGWVILGAAYGGDRCAKFGSSKTDVTVLSPKFEAWGADTLVFVAAPFGKDGNTLDVYVNDVLLGVFTLERGKWTTIRAPFTGKGATVIQFTPKKRFFLDDVKVVAAAGQTSGIDIADKGPTTNGTGRIYRLNGQYVGTSLDSLPRGIYIQDGKKILK